MLSHRIAIVLAFALLLKCAPVSSAETVTPIISAQSLRLAIEVEDDLVFVRLINDGDFPANASRAYSLSGRGGGNVLAVIVTELGQQLPPCAFWDGMVNFREPQSLLAKGERVIWKGKSQHLVNLHCVENGKHSLAFVYRAPDGDLVMSETATLVVNSGGESSIELREPVKAKRPN